MSIVTPFTPLESTIGGALIGAAAALLMLGSGRVAGISGILKRIIGSGADNQPLQALAFVVGLVFAPLVWTLLSGRVIEQHVDPQLWLAGVSGALVGFGTGYGSGCTSGHGVCGLSRLSIRSAVAVGVFMAVAASTVFVTRHVLGVR